MQDREIVSLYWKRNQEAIIQSEKKYGSCCFAIAHNILGCIEDSQECVSDTWLHAWNAIPPKKPEKLGIFLSKITRNLSLNRLRDLHAQKRSGGESVLVLEELAECIASSENVEAQLEAKELGEFIRRFVRKLPERERNIFVRRYFYTDPVADIAKRYGLTENNVMVTLSRTRKKLRTLLIKEGFLNECI